MRSLIYPYKKWVASLAGVSLVSAFMEALFIVVLTAIAMALVSGEGQVGPVFGRTVGLNVALGVAAIALVLRVSLSMVEVWIAAAFSARVTVAQRRVLARSYLGSSWGVQREQPSGQLQALLTDFVNQIVNIIDRFTKALSAGLSLVALLSTGVAIDWLATSSVLVALIVVGAVLIPLRRAIRRRSKRNSEANLNFAKAVSELGSLGQEMQTFGVSEQFEARIDEWTVKTTETKRLTQHFQGALPHVYLSLAYAAVLVAVAVLPMIGVSNLGAIGAVMLLMLRSLSYGQQLATASASIAAGQPFLERVDRMVTDYIDNRAPRGETIPTALAPIDVRDVSFSYVGQDVSLHDLNFQIRAGEAMGVIGPSGAGKSTLAQLLLGLRSPTQGRITVADVLMENVDREWWTERTAFVPQEAQLFTGTVAENIRFFRDGIDDVTLREVAVQANILDDIERLPNGFDTHLGERGGQLSGGQRQRLSIARALAGKPELVVLDEPTSALDGLSEALIKKTLLDLHGSISIVIIAHRMSTLDVCDRIMVLEDGVLAGLGTPGELRESNEFYRRASEVAGIAE